MTGTRFGSTLLLVKGSPSRADERQVAGSFAAALREPMTRPQAVGAVVGTPLLVFLTIGLPAPGAAICAAAFVLSTFLAIVPHETGHATAALLFGRELLEVQIGVPWLRAPRVLRLFGVPVTVGPPCAGLGGHVLYRPVLPPARRALVLLAGPAAGAAALGAAALLTPWVAVQHGLLAALVLHLTGNLVPDDPTRSTSDGTQLSVLAHPARRQALRAAEARSQAIHGWNRLAADSDHGNPAPLLAAVERLLPGSATDPERRKLLLRLRAAHRYRAGQFQDAAADYAHVDGRSDSWADTLIAAVLFRQLPADHPDLPAAAERVRHWASVDPSLPAGHALGVLRLLQGRHSAAWQALSRRGLDALAPSEQAAVLGARTLCAPDPSTRRVLLETLTKLAPGSPWHQLVTDTSNLLQPPVSRTKPPAAGGRGRAVRDR